MSNCHCSYLLFDITIWSMENHRHVVLLKLEEEVRNRFFYRLSSRRLLTIAYNRNLQITFWCSIFWIIIRSVKTFLCNSCLQSIIFCQMSKTRGILTTCLKISHQLYDLILFLCPDFFSVTFLGACESGSRECIVILCLLMKLFLPHERYYNMKWNILSFFYS